MAKEGRLESYPWYPSDWRSDPNVVRLDTAARGLYREILDLLWEHGEIANDPSLIRKMAGVEIEDWERSWAVVLPFFSVIDGNLRHRKVDDKRPTLLVLKASRSAVSSAGGRATARRKHTGSTAASTAASTPQAVPTVCPSPSPSPSPELLRNSIPLDGEEFSDPNLTEGEPGYWAEKLYEAHPKKKDRVLVFGAVFKIWNLWSPPPLNSPISGPVEMLQRVEERHSRWCAYWNATGIQYAPSLARWLEDRGWTVEPPAVDGSRRLAVAPAQPKPTPEAIAQAEAEWAELERKMAEFDKLKAS